MPKVTSEISEEVKEKGIMPLDSFPGVPVLNAVCPHELCGTVSAFQFSISSAKLLGD